MKSEFIKSLTENFESFAHKTDEELEFWLARDLQKLLGYTQWRNFENVIEKAKISCKTAEVRASDHFADVGKMIELGKGGEREVDDMMLTRYACYLIAQNGNPQKEQMKKEKKLQLSHIGLTFNF